MYRKLLMGLAAAALVNTSLYAASNTAQVTNSDLRYATPQATATDPQSVILAFTKAWNAHDAKAMAALWADDGDLLDPWGKWAKGRNAVARAFTEDQSGRFKESTINQRIDGVRFLGPLAIVDTSARLTGGKDADGKPMEALDHHVMWVMQKQGSNDWKIVAARPYMLQHLRTLK